MLTKWGWLSVGCRGFRAKGMQLEVRVLQIKILGQASAAVVILVL